MLNNIKNKFFNRFIGFSIEVLFLTNLWIIFYNSLLTYLSFLFPPVVKEQLLRNIAFPNPFKIPLYLFLSFIFICIIWLYHKIFNKLYQNFTNQQNIYRYLVLFILLLLFLSKLGSYPLGNDPSPYSIRPDKTIYTIVIGLYIAVVAIIVVESFILERFIVQKKITVGFLYRFSSLYRFCNT